MTPADAIRHDGFYIARAVLAPPELDELRRVARRHLREAAPMASHLGLHDYNLAAKRPELAWLFAHPGVLEVVRACVGSREPVFTGHSDLAMNRLSGWHKDSNGYFSGDYFSDPAVQVVKLACYMQDHPSGRGGLTVQPGSHRSPDLEFAGPVPLETRAGDLIAFDVRLNHTGQLPNRVEARMLGVARRLGYPKFHPRAFAAAKDAYWRIRGVPDRLSLFFTYGPSNDRTMEFSRRTQERQNEQLALAGRPPETGRIGDSLTESLAAARCGAWRP